MKTKSTIAIIGSTGNMGSAIAKSLAKGRNRLLLFGRDEAKLDTLKTDIRALNNDAEVETIGCPKDASWEADIVILAVPYAAEAAVAEEIRPYITQKIVISIANPMNQTFDGMVTPADSSAAQELQKLLPDAQVVKAFNTTYAANFAEPVIAGKPADAFVAGDDEQAVQTVVSLVESMGLHPVVAGGLAVSHTLEHMQLLLIQLTVKNNYNWHAGWKILHH
ncbi:NADPH-dependent F420 reductase [Parapedobacter sp. 10938]|uniref:NADPH-dependent F420 reductase n=1 Tax=Parapedobacter flavus TaxID=3110225 RepID=UPI002DB9FB4F|nr:NAD(P)-binding domain-containing protein [Parapedobacter sp. 10938]MEC3880067.1 NAD(P)-binding domain-containing protein [Parapedobacter sp. 10938]